MNKNQSFSFESTLSGKTWLSFLKQAKANGYLIRIYFIYLKNVKMNLERIKKRVAMGGHNIEPSIVKRRYGRAFYNFWFYYRPWADDWHIFDNSGNSPKLVTTKSEFDLWPQSKQNILERKFRK